MLYQHELQGLWYLMTLLVKYVGYGFISHPIISGAVALVFIFLIYSFFLCFYLRFNFFVEGLLVFPAKNAGVFVDSKIHPTKVPLNPFRWLRYAWSKPKEIIPDIAYSVPVFLIFAGIACHYLWFIFYPKLIFIGLMLLTIVFMFLYGYLALLLTIILTILLNVAYFYNFGIGFPVLEPHYTSTLVGWIVGMKNNFELNPTDTTIDINKYIYVFFLCFCYLTLFRYILNGIYWKKAKHEPNPRFNQFYVDDSSQITQKTNDKTPENSYLEEDNTKNDLVLDENSTVNHNTIRGTANSGKENEKNEIQENQLHSLKLMGFHQGSIRIMQSEYSVEIIDKVLNRLKLADNIAHPKEQFLAEISKLNKA